MDMRQVVLEHPLLAIMRNIPLEKTLDYAKAIIDGGISFFEVALNSKDGLQQITMLRDKFGDKRLIGAGTAVSVELAKAALDAGAQFLLAPSAPTDVLKYCSENDVYFLPGVLSPSDVGTCLRYGFSTLKLFPAGDMPRKYVKSLKGPFDQVDYVAIGGVTPDNFTEFLDAGCIGVGFGSNLMPKQFVRENNWEVCTQNIVQIVAKANNKR
jgi:2-dehydro-3-deoxyphosphogluconate aldolase/(4S)-4-hydroxy-2-oxoglutarate aldolase